VLLAIVAAAPLFSLPEPTPSRRTGSVPSKRIERFDGTIRVADREVRVTIDTWLIPNGQNIEGLDLPLRGLTIVELRGGSIVTIIDGRRVKRRSGDFWTVPPTSRMALQTEDDSAALATTVVAE
jgi:hypothetical protein